MTTIDMTGVWKSAEATQKKREEVNRPGYDALAETAAAASMTKASAVKTSTRSSSTK